MREIIFKAMRINQFTYDNYLVILHTTNTTTLTHTDYEETFTNSASINSG